MRQFTFTAELHFPGISAKKMGKGIPPRKPMMHVFLLFKVNCDIFCDFFIPFVLVCIGSIYSLLFFV
jgi:hypothetical protein